MTGTTEFDREISEKVSSREVRRAGTGVSSETLYMYSTSSDQHHRRWFVWTESLPGNIGLVSFGNWLTEDEAKVWLRTYATDRVLEEHFPTTKISEAIKFLRALQRLGHTALSLWSLRAALLVCLELAPFIAAVALVYLGAEITKIWSLKSTEERQLESTGYTFAFRNVMGSETVVGFARGMNFVADCPDVGVISYLSSLGDKNDARLALKIITREKRHVDGARSNDQCRTLLIGLSGRLKNEGHQMPEGFLKGTYYYKNSNNEHASDTVFVLDISKQQEVDDNANIPAGWREVALLEMAVESPYVYFGYYGEQFSELLPFSRALEVLVSTHSPNLPSRIRDQQQIELPQSYGLAAFFLRYAPSPDMQIVSQSTEPVDEAQALFGENGACACFGYSSLDPTWGVFIGKWFLERPENLESRQIFAVTIGAAIIGLGLAFGVEALFVWMGRLRGKLGRE